MVAAGAHGKGMERMSTYDLMASELREQRELAVATIQRQNELYESVSQQLQDARGEIKRKDAGIEKLQELLEHRANYAGRLRIRLKRKDDEIKRLRESLEGIEGFARMLCETQDQMHPAHIRLVAMITDAATAALYFPPGAHWYTPDSYDPETGIWHDKLGGDNLYQSDKQNPIRVVGKDSADD